MPTRRAVVCVCALAMLGAAGPASAQSSQSTSNRATGENYHVEIFRSLWDPTPAIVINSESIDGIIGSDIDFVNDLGIEKAWFTQLKVVLRPATKHKFRFEYTPIKYEASSGAEAGPHLQRHRVSARRSRSRPSSPGGRTASRMNTTSSIAIAASWGSCSRPSTPTSRRR